MRKALERVLFNLDHVRKPLHNPTSRYNARYNHEGFFHMRLILRFFMRII